MPDTARANTKAGAIAFVRHYIDLINYAQATGDVDPLREAETSECDSCAKVRQSIEQIYRTGGTITGGAWHPAINSALHNSDGSWLVTGYITFDPQKVTRSSGGPTEANEGGAATTHLTVKHIATHWKVTMWSRES
jgi:hypothetical protein